tara:strand:- start:2180 stop:2620 length:441 start_codon:yes stop_codon:yes gene_type:complete
MIRYVVAGCLLACALLSFLASDVDIRPEPQPVPFGINLRGKFIGPTAAEDAVALGTLCDAIANIIEFDSGKRLTTGVKLDDLRITAREFRTNGVSIGDRQPHVREAIHGFLDQELGIDGGPVSVSQRIKWITSYRAIAGACFDATK